MPSFDSNAMRNRATGLLSGFSIGQRAVVLVAAVTLIAGGVFFAQWAAKPTMTPLFSNVSTDDASSITAALQKNGTQYELTNGGQTIMVPKDQVYQLRLDMASQNLPTGGSQGYKLLDEKSGSITQSEFSEQINYQRALEGELSNTIGSIANVQNATVHLVIPKTDVFSDDQVKPTASVLVQTAPGKTLNSSAVQSIVNLTASSVEGLTNDNVTVADSNGKLLSADGAAGGSDSDTQAAQALSVESQLNEKIQALLNPVVGSGKAVVKTTAELNWDKSHSVAEVYNPTNKAVTPGSQSTTAENYGAGATQNSTTGCIGTYTPDATAACTTPTTVGAAAGGTGAYSKIDNKQDNLVDKTVTETTKAAGTPQRITVAVLLDSSVPNVDQQKVTDLVTQAAGLQTARGDVVTVTSMPFDTASATAAADALKQAEKDKKQAAMMGYAKTGATFLIILIVLIVLFITTRRRAGKYTSTPISMAELDAGMAALPSADSMMNALEEQVAADNSPEALERAKVDKEITDLIEKQPDEVAGLLRSWLADRRS